MNSETIIKDIRNIYKRFPVTKHLQNHMMQVAAIGQLIAEHWKGPALNRDDLLAFLLLHDIGNIVKFDFTQKAMFTPDEDLKLWEQRQKETIARYGTETDTVILAFAREIGVSERILHLLANSSFINLEKIRDGDDWEQKIGKYCDLRVAPKGVVLLTERIADIEKRYAGKLPPNTDALFNVAYDVEKQIFAQCEMKPEEITDERIAPIIKNF